MSTPSTRPTPAPPSRLRTWIGGISQFLVLFGFWLVLSSQWRPLFFLLGALSAAAVTALTHHIVTSVLEEPAGHVLRWISRVGWFVVYVAWMLWSIAAASVLIARGVLNLGRPFEPEFVTFESGLRRPLSNVLVAVSITLVPGTQTLELQGDRFLVHALTPGSADDLATARLQNMVARITGEERVAPPEMTWSPVVGGTPSTGEADR
jgi:multicomponent Na+:H+ antiporter subunit E